MQYYGLTGRKIKPDYVGMVNSGAKYLPQKREIEETAAYRNKSLADTEDYRNRTLALEGERMAQNERIAAENERFSRDALKAQERDAKNSNMIGLGQLAYKAYSGRQRDNALKDVLTGGDSQKASGAIAPSNLSPSSPAKMDNTFYPEGDNTRPDSTIYGLGKTTGSPSSWGDSVWEGVKGGASNWGDIASGGLVGATVGSKLGEKYIRDSDLGRAAGAALTSGALTYLSSGNPYSSALSGIFGGALSFLF